MMMMAHLFGTQSLTPYLLFLARPPPCILKSIGYAIYKVIFFVFWAPCVPGLWWWGILVRHVGYGIQGSSSFDYSQWWRADDGQWFNFVTYCACMANKALQNFLEDPVYWEKRGHDWKVSPKAKDLEFFKKMPDLYHKDGALEMAPAEFATEFQSDPRQVITKMCHIHNGSVAVVGGQKWGRIYSMLEKSMPTGSQAYHCQYARSVDQFDYMVVLSDLKHDFYLFDDFW